MPAATPVNTEYMRARRRELGLTQAKVAVLAELSSTQHYNDIERGSRPRVHVETLRRIAWALSCSLDNLVRPFEPAARPLDRSRPLLDSAYQWPPPRA